VTLSRCLGLALSSWPSSVLANIDLTCLSPLSCDVKVFLPTPHAGFAAVRAGLVTDTFLEAMTVEPVKRQYSDYVLTSEIEDKIELLQSGQHIAVKTFEKE